MSNFFGFGLGPSTRSAAGDILDTWYPLPLKHPEGGVAEAVLRVGNREHAGPDHATLVAEALEVAGG